MIAVETIETCALSSQTPELELERARNRESSTNSLAVQKENLHLP